jgi:hypothetical protein
VNHAQLATRSARGELIPTISARSRSSRPGMDAGSAKSSYGEKFVKSVRRMFARGRASRRLRGRRFILKIVSALPP